MTSLASTNTTSSTNSTKKIPNLSDLAKAASFFCLLLSPCSARPLGKSNSLLSMREKNAGIENKNPLAYTNQQALNRKFLSTQQIEKQTIHQFVNRALLQITQNSPDSPPPPSADEKNLPALSAAEYSNTTTIYQKACAENPDHLTCDNQLTTEDITTAFENGTVSPLDFPVEVLRSLDELALRIAIQILNLFSDDITQKQTAASLSKILGPFLSDMGFKKSHIEGTVGQLPTLLKDTKTAIRDFKIEGGVGVASIAILTACVAWLTYLIPKGLKALGIPAYLLIQKISDVLTNPSKFIGRFTAGLVYDYNIRHFISTLVKKLAAYEDYCADHQIDEFLTPSQNSLANFSNQIVTSFTEKFNEAKLDNAPPDGDEVRENLLHCIDLLRTVSHPRSTFTLPLTNLITNNQYQSPKLDTVAYEFMQTVISSFTLADKNQTAAQKELAALQLSLLKGLDAHGIETRIKSGIQSVILAGGAAL